MRHGSGRDATDAKDLRKRIGALPGYGEMKIKSLERRAREAVRSSSRRGDRADHPTLGDVTSPEDLDRYQSWKRAYKKAARGAGAGAGV